MTGGKWKLVSVTHETRLAIAVLTSVAVVFSYYGVQFHRGYVKAGFTHFPWAVGVTDLPRCPSCDHIGLSSPILEVLGLSALVFGLFSLRNREEVKSVGEKWRFH